jgi:hypothetical protein
LNIQRRRLLALLDYVQQAARSRVRGVSNVADHGRFLLFDHQASGYEGLRVHRGDAAGEPWLAVDRPDPPGLPPRAGDGWIDPWIEVGDVQLAAPRIAPSVPGSALIAAGTHRDGSAPATSVAELAVPEVLSGETVAFATYPFRAQVEARFARYLEQSWRPWAEAERRRRRHARLYLNLMTLEQELSGALGDGGLELQWGFGLLSGRRAEGGTPVVHPLLLQPVDLQFDPATGRAAIVPRASEPRLDLEPFEAAAPGSAEADARAALRAADEVTPFDPDTWNGALAPVTRWLDGAGLLEPGWRIGGWVLFARTRGGGPLAEDLDRFARSLVAAGAEVALPAAAAALVTEPATEARRMTLPRFRGLAGDRTDGNGASRELCFPKPYNDEQVRIAQLLEAHDGVVVQGPPGTGKTHTIANIICHNLAQGRRILVTSMKDPALEVLREHMPAALRPLAVTLLGAGRPDGDQFDQAIEAIARELQNLDADAAEAHLAGLSRQLDLLHGRLASIDTALGSLAGQELDRIRLDGESLTTADAAAEVAASAVPCDWIPDALGSEPAHAPRFSEADVRALLDARARLGPMIEHAGRTLPPAADLPDGATLLRLHRQVTGLLAESASGEGLPVATGTAAADPGRLAALATALGNLRSLREAVAASADPWAPGLLRSLRAGERRDAMAILEALGAELGQAEEARQRFVARPVNAPQGAERDAVLLAATQNLASGRSAFGLASAFFRAEAKQRLSSFEVEGNAPAGPEAWKHVTDFLELQARWRTLATRWNAVAAELGLAPVADDDPAEGPQAAAQYARVRRLQAQVRDETALERDVLDLFPGWTRACAIAADPEALGELEAALQQQLHGHGLAGVWAERDALDRRLAQSGSPLTERMRRFIAGRLGRPGASDAALLEGWSALLEERTRLAAATPDLETVQRVADAIEASGAPLLAMRVRAHGATGLPPADRWLPAWRLRRLAGRLGAGDLQERTERLARQRLDAEHDLASAYHDLAVTRTWYELARNATPAVRAGLQAYLNATQKLGKGTGKRAARYRRDAREAAAEAQRAIPCWIMPHHRVAETLPSEWGLFDLVIVDEASQSDLSALPAILRARRLLVVGDDRQVSPDGIGLEEKRIVELMERHLQEQVPLLRAQMSPERSAYDLARVAFADAVVMLREHFRCVAPIIEYSKREFYGHQLIPLRLPPATERLDPPLVDVLLPDGAREGDVNPAEIDWIVDEISRITLDPAFAGRSIGVVSLLGEEQAQRIWERLLDALPLETLRRHAISCGDARTFQGRERDVLFLSMVASGPGSIAPLTRDVFQQRFNVAASRARDRMVLVRSVEVDQLSPADRLRRGLIAHFAEPFREAAPAPGDPRNLCGSSLERAVYDWLTGRGYRVTPRVPVGAMHIDLVVEGEGDARLAIACDGDRGETAGQWLEELRRQRTLERVGWRFWRCFASAWVQRPQAVERSLEAALRQQGIVPAGQERRRAADHVPRRMTA